MKSRFFDVFRVLSNRIKRTRTAQTFGKLHPRRQSLVIKILAGILVFFLIWYIASVWEEREKRVIAPGKEEPKEKVDLKIDQKILKDVWYERESRRITELETQVKSIMDSIKSLHEEITSLKNSLLESLPPEKITENATQPDLKKEIDSKREQKPVKKPTMEKFKTSEIDTLYPVKYPEPKPYEKKVQQQSAKHRRQQRDTTGPALAALIDAEYQEPPVKPLEEKRKEDSIVVPDGFVKGVLLAGVAAPTGLKGQKMPLATLIRLEDMAFLPNEWRGEIQGCLALGEAYGDLSAERVYIRINAVSCMTKDGKYLRAESTGYVVEDGHGSLVGLAGKPRSRRGYFLARRLFVDIVNGIAKAFRFTSTTVSVTPLGGTVESYDTKDSLKLAFGTAGDTAAKNLSEFFKTLAEETFPVIEVSAGRQLYIVFTSPLEFKIYKETQKIIKGDSHA